MRPPSTTNAESSIGGRRRGDEPRAFEQDRPGRRLRPGQPRRDRHERRRQQQSAHRAPHSTRLCAMTNLGMNERAWALAGSRVPRARDELRIARAQARLRCARDRRRRQRAWRSRCRPRAGGALHGRPRRRRADVAHDRRRIVARRPGLDRSSRRGVHGVAVRRLGDQSRRILRDGIGAAAREGPRRERAVWQAGLRRGRDARRAGARGTHASDRRCGEVDCGEGGHRARAR